MLVERWPNSVLDIDDIPSRLYSTRAQAGKHFVRTVLDKRLCWIWRRREARLLSRFDVLVVCSEEDRNYLGNKNRVHVAPNGFDLPEIVPIDIRSIPARLGFIGLFHYKPQRGRCQMVHRGSWPAIKCKVPEAALRSIGSGSEAFARLEHGIEGWGWVADPGPEIATWAAMVVPYEGVVEHA